VRCGDITVRGVRVMCGGVRAAAACWRRAHTSRTRVHGQRRARACEHGRRPLSSCGPVTSVVSASLCGAVCAVPACWRRAHWCFCVRAGTVGSVNVRAGWWRLQGRSRPVRCGDVTVRGVRVMCGGVRAAPACWRRAHTSRTRVHGQRRARACGHGRRVAAVGVPLSSCGHVTSVVSASLCGAVRAAPACWRRAHACCACVHWWRSA
jgi:hypothetical protein